MIHASCIPNNAKQSEQHWTILFMFYRHSTLIQVEHIVRCTLYALEYFVNKFSATSKRSNTNISNGSTHTDTQQQRKIISYEKRFIWIVIDIRQLKEFWIFVLGETMSVTNKKYAYTYTYKFIDTHSFISYSPHSTQPFSSKTTKIPLERISENRKNTFFRPSSFELFCYSRSF